MKPYYADESVTLWHGKALDVLREMPDASVDCCVTSPPYFGLRDYGVEGQQGLEQTPGEYVEGMREVFAEVRRTLTAAGTLWVNLGDSYSTPQRGSDEGWDKSRLSNPGRVQKMQFAALREGRHLTFDRPFKSLLGIPWRVAFALQDDGWLLRNANVWNKTNAMPESVTDRLSNRYELVFMFSKSRRYYFDLDAIREDRQHSHPPRETNKHAEQRGDNRYGGNVRSMHETGEYLSAGKNPGDVWTVPTVPFAEAHFACMPPALADRCVASGCVGGGSGA